MCASLQCAHRVYIRKPPTMEHVRFIWRISDIAGQACAFNFELNHNVLVCELYLTDFGPANCEIKNSSAPNNLYKCTAHGPLTLTDSKEY